MMMIFTTVFSSFGIFPFPHPHPSTNKQTNEKKKKKENENNTLRAWSSFGGEIKIKHQHLLFCNCNTYSNLKNSSDLNIS